MFIVHESKQNRLKPHRGGMARSGENHAAPTELERIIGGTVTIHMSLLRSWAWAGLGYNSYSLKESPADLQALTTIQENNFTP